MSSGQKIVWADDDGATSMSAIVAEGCLPWPLGDVGITASYHTHIEVIDRIFFSRLNRFQLLSQTNPKHKGQQQQAVHGELTVTVLDNVRFLLYKVIKIKHVSFHIVN